MNIFIGTGKVIRVKLLSGKMNMLKFTLVITESDSTQKERTDYVPCIIYNPSESAKRLISENQGVELQGKVRTFSFEITGETNYKTEIIVNQNSITALK